MHFRASLVAQMVNNPPAMQETWVRFLLQCRRPGKIPWRRDWQPAPILLPGKFNVQRSLVSYSPWGHKVLLSNAVLFSFHNDRYYCQGLTLPL